ncbi:MAG: hypothetical protein AAF411_28085 [Myxococcota bacterium]
MSESRIPTPAVLAIASTMVCIGVVARFSLAPDDDEGGTAPASRARLDDRTAESTAESFLDAWRKRDHDTAERLATGAALAEVQRRRASDASLTEAETELRREVWAAMAATRLDLVLSESEDLPGGDLRLAGTAEGTFIDREYAREVEFVLRDTNGSQPRGHRVVEVRFGEILSDLPAAFHFEH